MAQIPTTNIGMNLLQNEYGGNNPISMSEYYRSANSNNGQLVKYSTSTAPGYTGITNQYPPGTNSSSGQNGSYVRQTFVYRYPYYIASNGVSVFGADSGQPIGQALGSRNYYWAGNLEHSEVFDNYASNGAGTYVPLPLGVYGQNLYNYYIPYDYIYKPTGGLWGSKFGGCQNPNPVNVTGISYPYSSIGPYTGVAYPPLDGIARTYWPPGIYAMQSRVYYGLVRTVNTWFPGGTQLLNTTVPQISYAPGPISLGDFKNQQN